MINKYDNYPVTGVWYELKEDDWCTYPIIFQNVLFEYRANTPFGEIFLVGEGEYIGQNRVHLYKDQVNIPMSEITGWRYLPDSSNEIFYTFHRDAKDYEEENDIPDDASCFNCEWIPEKEEENAAKESIDD